MEKSKGFKVYNGWWLNKGRVMKRLTAMVFLWIWSAVAAAVVTPPAVLENTKPFDSRGNSIPVDSQVRDSGGEVKALKAWLIEGKPTLLTFNYLGCAMLCSLQQDGLARSLAAVDLKAGDDFAMLTVSIDPNEDRKVAARASERMSEKINGLWSVLTAPEASIAELTTAAGFNFEYLEKEKQFAHPAITYVLTPDGRVSQYLMGLEPEPRDLKFALIEASGGEIGSFIEQISLACLQYDSSANAYVARGVMRAGGVVILAGLGIFFGLLWRRERSRWD